MQTCTVETKDEGDDGEQEKAADLAAALVSLCGIVRRHWAYSEVLLTR
jgi:hypothetical protein